MTEYTKYVVRGGVDSFGVFKEEETYNTNPGSWDTDAHHFGITQTITPTINRNLIKIRGQIGLLPASNNEGTARDAKKILGGSFESSFNVDFQPQDFSFLKYFFGSVSEDVDVKYYPQESATTDEEKKKYLKVPSITLATRIDLDGETGTDHENFAMIYTGSICNTASINAALGEPVSCTMAFVCASAEQIDAEDIPYTAISSDDVYHFTEASVEYGGSELDYVMDGFEFNGENSAAIIGTIGQYDGVHGYVGERNVSVNIDLTYGGKKLFTDILGGTEVGKPIKIDEIVLTLKKTDTKNLKIHLKNLKLPSLDPSVNYGEIMKGTVTLEAEYAYAIENQNLA